MREHPHGIIIIIITIIVIVIVITIITIIITIHNPDDTQGDYVGSVHQSSGGFRTAGSPICGDKIILFFFSFFSYFVMQALQAAFLVSFLAVARSFS